MINLIAHRGNDNHKYKENTKEAILECLKRDYIAGVEFDIRMTKDKKIVIIHNSTIGHASDGWGFVKYMTLKQLRKYNFGSKEHVSKIATLEEVLKEIKSDKKIVIEIKNDSSNYKTLVDKIVKISNKYPYINFYYCSFNHELITYFKKKYPQFKIGIIYLFSPDYSKMIFFDFYTINYLFINQATMEREIMIWTVNDKDIYNKIIKKFKDYSKFDVDIITDSANMLIK